MLKKSLLYLLGAAALAACTGPDEPARLPILGERDVVPRADGGPADTVYATAPAFRLTNQHGVRISNATFAGRAYITDFFFATCPGICPKMQGELLKVYQQFGDNPRVAYLSMTIDPAHDTLAVLRDYAQRLGVGPARQWHFATASQDSIMDLVRGFFTAAQPDAQAPGGFAHNGTFALVDDQGHIRGLYDSLNKDQVAKLLGDLPILLAEMKTRQPGVATR